MPPEGIPQFESASSHPALDLNVHEIDYQAQSHWHHFRFRVGEMIGLDRARREVLVAPFLDEDGNQVTPQRVVGYDTLVIAVGGLTNDFGTPGVKEHAVSLDSTEAAERFRRRLVNACIRADAQVEALGPGQLNVAIIGAGATGVELAAELHGTTRQFVAYGLDPEKDVRIVLLEAAGRILPALPERLAKGAADLLGGFGVRIMTSARVAEVTADGVRLADGTSVPAELVVWAAGVRAPDFLKTISELEVNRLNQIMVRPTLQTTVDDDIFAIGDCACCPWHGRDGAFVPPRAQAAHQQADHMIGQVWRRRTGRPLSDFRYRDFGSLVSFGEYSTIGSLMGALVGGSLWVEGLFARLMYLSLYKMHEIALHGHWKVILDTLARTITRRTVPHVKLH
jgi:NADH dehydrogenase